MPPEKHALLSASSAHRWLNCPGSARLTENMPDTTSPYAEAGCLAHEIAELKARQHFIEAMPKRSFNARLKKLRESEHYDKSMDAATDEYLEHLKARAMSYPIEREGQLYSDDEMRKYFELPEGEPDAVLAVCDTKTTGADYAFLPILYQYGQDYYLEACICDNGKEEVVEARIAEALLAHKVQMARFESNSAGGTIARNVHEMIKDKGGRCHIATKYTTDNKQTIRGEPATERASARAKRAAAGNFGERRHNIS